MRARSEQCILSYVAEILITFSVSRTCVTWRHTWSRDTLDIDTHLSSVLPLTGSCCYGCHQSDVQCRSQCSPL